MASFDFTDFTGVVEEYARDNKNHIIDEILVPGIDKGIAGSPIKPIDYYMASLPTEDEVVLTQIFTSDILQPGGKDTFNPKNNIVGFVPRIGKVRPLKIDALFSHTEILRLYKTYMGACDSLKIDPEEIPFEKYLMDAIMKRAKQNLRVKTLMNGVYNAADATPLGCFNGLRKLVNDAIVAEDIPDANVIDITAISNTNAVAQFELGLAALPDEDFYSDMICLCNRAQKTAYELDYRTRYGTLPYNLSQGKQTIVGSEIEFVVEPGLAGFTKPIFVHKDNFHYLYDNRGEISSLAVDYDKRTRSMAFVADAQAGLQFANGKTIWVLQPTA
jgi:hypothetical protein